ncbi:hypothetical protein ASC97_10765 [Rhizobium sp. Root1203]|uniref:hypothetical protein n=1 Tax=Rhizobium sp. Root1203 TaxID=1736427 RepID=UPI0007092417|nr:hypothetical protein [Rhizobium sp. Root1203]KQV20476.1 hypothetical protein ASC97_10765 [Rhizobium sp. Root1203]
MEIISMRSSPNFLFRNNSNNQKSCNKLEDHFEPAKRVLTAFQVNAISTEEPDFSAISPSELRNYARQSYDTGAIDQDTFAAISEPLPMRTIDPAGDILDLSGVTDGTSFNFRDYYKDQLQVAMSIGDPETVETLKSVVSFLDV